MLIQQVRFRVLLVMEEILEPVAQVVPVVLE
jgi:hypothetical protein